MGKKKRGHPDVEEVLARPWCYYCERDFDDLKILISHQKAKHFKCERCGRRLNTAGGLSVHMNQVHKESLNSVENALPNRAGLEVEIFGMEGIPEEVVTAHNQRVLQQYYEAEAERRAATGNPGPGGSNPGSGSKKTKIESAADLKKRLAEHKAKKASEVAGGNSGDVTPMGAGKGTQSPGAGPSSLPFSAISPPFAAQHGNFLGHQGSPPAQYPHPFGQPPFAQGQPNIQVQPPLHPQQAAFNPSHTSPFPSTGPPQYPLPNQQFPQALGQPLQGALASPATSSFATDPAPGSLHQGPHQLPQQQQVPILHRQGGLPAPSGLPQRPLFSTPQVNTLSSQQMHQGPFDNPAYPSTPRLASHAVTLNGPSGQALHRPLTETGHIIPADGDIVSNGGDFVNSRQQSSVNELIPNAAQDVPHSPRTVEAAADVSQDRRSKKEKDKKMRLVYSDNERSPEEKMAQLSRYAFIPHRTETLELGSVGPAVTGIVNGPDDIIDEQG